MSVLLLLLMGLGLFADNSWAFFFLMTDKRRHGHAGG